MSGIVGSNTTRSSGVIATAEGGGPSLGDDHVIRTNAKTIDSNINFLGSENGMTAGPISISDGITVTVASGSTWTII